MVYHIESRKTIPTRPEKVNPSADEISKFWNKVEKLGPNECWIWQGYRDKDGYGVHSFRCWPIRAHHFSWILEHGEIEKGLCILHDCPNGDCTACVNPKHLWKGTNAENIADRHAKGRDATGSSHGTKTCPERVARGVANAKAKLNDEMIRDIRRRRMSGETFRAIARAYGVQHGNIIFICSGKTWAHVI